MNFPGHLRDLLIAVAVLMVIAISVDLAFNGLPGSAASVPSRWQTASDIANSLEDDGAVLPLAECAGERVVDESPPAEVARLRANPAYAQHRSRETLAECEGSYDPSGGAPLSGEIEIDPEASAIGFAHATDAICAVDFNEALRREAELKGRASVRHWNEERYEAEYNRVWAASEAQTARLATNLGKPPENSSVVRAWQENVAERARLFGAKAKAWGRGEEDRALRINERVMSMKEEADRLGDSFGLRVCTSN